MIRGWAEGLNHLSALSHIYRGDGPAWAGSVCPDRCPEKAGQSELNWLTGRGDRREELWLVLS